MHTVRRFDVASAASEWREMPRNASYGVRRNTTSSTVTRCVPGEQ